MRGPVMKEETIMRRLQIGAVALGAALISVPIPSHAQTVDIGKQEYTNSCAVCHGANGKGAGPLADFLNKKVPDLTKLAKNNSGLFSFDRVYWVIDGRQTIAAHGPRDMPVWGDRYKSEAANRSFEFIDPKQLESFVRGRIIALIGYIYSLQAK